MKYLGTCFTFTYTIAFLIFIVPAHPQRINVHSFEYLSPLANSTFVSPFSNIIIRYGKPLDVINSEVQNSINVSGSISGFHAVDIIFLDDGKTIIFKPIQPFTEGEKVSVELMKGLKTTDNDDIGNLSFDFYVADSWENNNLNNYSKMLLEDFKSVNQDFKNNNSTPSEINISNVRAEINTFELPNLHVTISNNPTDGYIFISPWLYQGNFEDPNYILIVDNYGIPIYYKRINALAMDFKIQPNGVLTYRDESTGAFYGMDSSYNVIDTFACGNGYYTDIHDLQLLPNNHYLVMSYDVQTVRMDTIVTGGDTAATVYGLILQELDENDNVVFQWRSWDHFQITDASYNIDLTAHTIDYVHGNSVEMDYDGNLIISCRHMNEVTKISRTTGDIIWRLGGEKNQFQFLNDNRGFSYQHDVRRLQNNNLTIFDNGNLSSPRYSSSIEYHIDEQNKIATRVWDYSDNNSYTPSMGNSTRLDNGRTFIGWGGSSNPAIIEVSSDGTKSFEMIFDPYVYSYRAFRHTWRTNLFTADRYNIDFGIVAIEDTATQQILITNNSNNELSISSYFSRSTFFSVVNEFPISLQAFEGKLIQVQFNPDTIGSFSDDIHLRVEEGNEMIAQVINVSGYSDSSIPVEIKSFTAFSEPGKVKLFWTIATETNNLGFEIERALSSPPSLTKQWQFIGFIKGSGTITKSIQYSFTDDLADINSKLIFYRLKQIDFDGNYLYSNEIEVENFILGEFYLSQNFPNPFNPTTTIKYSVKEATFVTLKVYDVLGNLVTTLVDEVKPAGSYDIEFSVDGESDDITSGVYFYRIEAGDFIDTKKIILMK